MAVQPALRIFINGLSSRFWGLKHRASALSNLVVVLVMAAITEKVEV